MLPAQQCLDAGDLMLAADLGLVIDAELLSQNGFPQILFKSHTVCFLDLHQVVKEEHSVAARVLGLVHGQIGPLENIHFRICLPKEKSHADADGAFVLDGL